MSNRNEREASVESQTARMNEDETNDARMPDAYVPECFRRRVGHLDQDNVLLAKARRAPRRRCPYPGPRTPFHSEDAFSPGDTMHARSI